MPENTPVGTHFSMFSFLWLVISASWYNIERSNDLSTFFGLACHKQMLAGSNVGTLAAVCRGRRNLLLRSPSSCPTKGPVTIRPYIPSSFIRHKSYSIAGLQNQALSGSSYHTAVVPCEVYGG